MTSTLDDARGEEAKGPDDCAEYMLLQARLKGQTVWTNIYAAQLGQFIGYGCEVRAEPVSRCDAESAGPTAEDIRACAWSTLIGWQHELGESIDFICDQIARKATLTHSSTHHRTPGE